MNTFIDNQWSAYCERLRTSAARYAGDDPDLQKQLADEAEQFIQANPVEDYGTLLEAMAKAQPLVLEWRSRSPAIEEQQSEEMSQTT
jgi:hypothetical protein